MDTETEEKSLKYWFVLVALLLLLVLFGVLESEPAKWLMGGSFLGIIAAGIAMNRVRDEKSGTVGDAPEPGNATTARPTDSQRQPRPVSPSADAPPGLAPIREVTARAVHGRAPFTVGDPELTITPTQRRAIEEHVRRKNLAAVGAAAAADVSTGTPAPERPAIPVDATVDALKVLDRVRQGTPADARRMRTAPVELLLELARLHEMSRNQSTKTRAVVERRLQEIDAADLPWPEVAREVEELFRAVRLERIAERQRGLSPSND